MCERGETKYWWGTNTQVINADNRNRERKRRKPAREKYFYLYGILIALGRRNWALIF